MKHVGIMNLTNLLCSLRSRLLEANDKRDIQLLNELKTTFTILREASYIYKDDAIIRILTALDDSAGDFIINEDWKSNVPSIEDIQNAISD